MASTLKIIVSPHCQKAGPILFLTTMTCSLKLPVVSKQHEVVVLVILTIGTSSTFTVSLVFPVSVCTVSLPSLMGSYSTSLITKFSYWISDYFNQPLFSSNVCFLKIWCAKLDCTLETVALKGQRGLNHHFIPVMYNFCIYFLVRVLVFATALYC